MFRSYDIPVENRVAEEAAAYESEGLPNRLLNAREVAKFVGCHEETNRRAYWRGLLRSQRFGVRGRRFPTPARSRSATSRLARAAGAHMFVLLGSPRHRRALRHAPLHRRLIARRICGSTSREHRRRRTSQYAISNAGERLRCAANGTEQAAAGAVHGGGTRLGTAGNRSLDTAAGRIKVLKRHIGELPVKVLAEPAIINRFKTESEYSRKVEISTLHKVLAILRAAIRWGQAQTPPLIDKSPFHRFGVRLNTKAETVRDRRISREEEKRLLDAALVRQPRTRRTGAFRSIRTAASRPS